MCAKSSLYWRSIFSSYKCLSYKKKSLIARLKRIERTSSPDLALPITSKITKSYKVSKPKRLSLLRAELTAPSLSSSLSTSPASSASSNLPLCSSRRTLVSSVWLSTPTRDSPCTRPDALACTVASVVRRCHPTSSPFLTALTSTCWPTTKINLCWLRKYEKTNLHIVWSLLNSVTPRKSM